MIAEKISRDGFPPHFAKSLKMGFGEARDELKDYSVYMLTLKINETARVTQFT